MTAFGLQTLAAWTTVHRAAMADAPMMDAVIQQTGISLDRIARDQFADPVSPRNVQLSDQHADFFISNVAAVLVEGRFFVRLNPNPMPAVTVFGPRMDAAIDRVQARAQRAGRRVRRMVRL